MEDSIRELISQFKKNPTFTSQRDRDLLVSLGMISHEDMVGLMSGEISMIPSIVEAEEIKTVEAKEVEAVKRPGRKKKEVIEM